MQLTQYTPIPTFEVLNMIDRIDPEDRKAEQERVEAARKEAEAEWLGLLAWPPAHGVAT